MAMHFTLQIRRCYKFRASRPPRIFHSESLVTQSAGQVCFENGVPLRVGEFQRWGAFGAAGAIDESLYGAELGADRLQ